MGSIEERKITELPAPNGVPLIDGKYSRKEIYSKGLSRAEPTSRLKRNGLKVLASPFKRTSQEDLFAIQFLTSSTFE